MLYLRSELSWERKLLSTPPQTRQPDSPSDQSPGNTQCENIKMEPHPSCVSMCRPPVGVTGEFGIRPLI
ncbi:unnamed protein product [Caretta caretta]